MKKKKTLSELLQKRARVLRVPPQISIPIVTMFCDLVQKSGLEWTISRFKSVKVDFIRVKAGQSIVTPWISKKGNYFKGPLGGLQRWAYKSDKNFDAAIQLLQIYSFFVAENTTPLQSEKFTSAVQSNDVYHQFFDAYADILLHATKRVFPDQSGYPDPGSLIFRPVNTSKNEPHASGASFPEGVATLQCAQSFLDQTATGKILVEKFPFLFGCVMSGVASVINSRQRFDFGTYQDIVGKIGLIQEPGFKLRAIANPARVYQEALKPFGDDLYRKLHSLPWDCTHDQTFPFLIIQDHLKDMKTAHAVDLSNATDMFPFELQYRMLHQMYHRKDAIELFAILSRSKWKTNLVGSGFISWTVGQPLGLFPSFAAFALTHGLMLFGLNGFKHDNKFFILGDDVIILDDGLYAKYMRFLENLGIPYSPSKTLSSNVITEFAGKVVLPNRVIPQLKWRRISDDSFIDLAKLIGPRLRSIMRPRQRNVFDIVSIIPDFLGGCGFNPAGIPLKERCEFYYSNVKEETLQSYLLSYNGRVQTMLYEPFRPVKINGQVSSRQYLNVPLLTGSWLIQQPPLDTFDQKVLDLLCQIPLNLDFISGSYPWKSLGSIVYNAFPRERFLQIDGKGGLHTTLEVLERKFIH